jgi:hypothetical protein
MNPMSKEAVNNIAEWLNKNSTKVKDFEQGVTLLDCFGSDKVKVRSIKQTRDGNKLISALIDLYKYNKSNIGKEEKYDAQVEVMSQAVATAPPAAKKVAANSLIIKMSDRKKELMKKAGAWHTQMFWIGRDKDGKALPLTEDQKLQRKLLAKQIQEAQEEITVIFADTAYLNVHGELPKSDKPARKKKSTEFSYVEYENTRKKIGTAKTTIASLISAIPNLKGTELAKANKRLDKWKATQAELEILFEDLKKQKANAK